jgi:hypothetical protein
MSDRERIKDLEARVKLLESRIGKLMSKMPHRSTGRKHGTPTLKDTVVPGRNS